MPLRLETGRHTMSVVPFEIPRAATHFAVLYCWKGAHVQLITTWSPCPFLTLRLMDKATRHWNVSVSSQRYSHGQTDVAVARETVLWPLASVMTSLSLLFSGRETQTFIKRDYVSRQQKGRETESHWRRQKRAGRHREEKLRPRNPRWNPVFHV